jgi:hypothetical protein
MRYARRLIPKDTAGFAKIREKCKPNTSPMKIYK